MVRLLAALLPHTHLFVAALLATFLYAGMITLRATLIYPVLRVVGENLSEEERGKLPEHVRGWIPGQQEAEDEEKDAGDVAQPEAGERAAGDEPAETSETQEQAGGDRPAEASEPQDAEEQPAVPGFKRTLSARDERFSDFLKHVNAVLDRMDAAMISVLRPVLPKDVRDNPKTLAQVGALGTAILLFVLMALGAGVGNYTESVLKSRLVLRVLVGLRIRLLQNLLNQPLAFYNEKKRGELITRMSADVGSAMVCLTTITGDMLRQPVTILFAVGLIGAINPWLLLIVGAVFPVIMVNLRRNSLRVNRRARRRQKKTVRVIEAMVQMFSGIRVVKAFGLERAKVEQYTQREADFARDALATDRAKAWTRTRMEFLLHMLMVLAVVTAMLVLGSGGRLPAGAMILFLILMTQLFRPVKVLTRAYTDLQDNLPGADRMYEFMELEPGLKDKPGAIALTDVVGGVRFEDVCFAYNGGGLVLDHVNLEVPAGQVVAFVGPSGAGKTTLVNLVPRFYDPKSGRITIDGTDIREFTRESLLRNIAIVTQDPFLFNTTIRENIAHGKPGATTDEIVAAAQAANIHDFILTLPRGYDTLVGERGANISGGQCQRITIARAILRDARILILDEATSSLDSENERYVQTALQNLMSNRTTLVIAHRLSTVQHADLICVMRDGHIVETGSHMELMARDSFYRRLYEMQFDTGVAVRD